MEMKQQRIVKTYRIEIRLYEVAAKKASEDNTTLAKKIEEFVKKQARKTAQS